MKPTAIPDGMGIKGAEKHVIKGDPDNNVEDVEALVGTDAGLPYFAMLIECDELDLRHLHLDSRYWHFQYGAPLHPFRMEPAFVSPVAAGGDPIAEELRAAGKLLGAAWFAHANRNQEALHQALGMLVEKIANAESARQITADLKPKP